MHRHPLFFTLLTTIAVAAVFLVGYRFGDHRKLAADLSATIGFLNNASSSGNATTSPADGGSTSTPTLADVLEELQNQEQFLTGQITDLRSQLEVVDLKTVFTRIMKRGDSGDDVSRLQELLGKISDTYPSEADASDTMTGYYGRLTEVAVARFQKQAGLKQTGVVDQDTKKKLYESAAGLVTDEGTSTEFAPIDLSTVADLRNLVYLQDQISQSAADSSSTQISQLVSIVSSTQASILDLQNQISGIASDVSNLQASAPIAQSSSPAPAPSPAPASPPPPLSISSVQAGNITKTSSTITWTTNNLSTSEVDYSQNSGLPKDQTTVASDAATVTSHKLVLLGLNAGTTYYYRVVSKDSGGVVASSTGFSFGTLH